MAPNVAAEWLSAWATFWGAIAGAIGAIGTAGALWLGAITFRRQVRDQHRAQAAAVTLAITKTSGRGTWAGLVRNDSLLPIFDLALVGVDANGNDVDASRHERPYLPGTTAQNANSYGGILQKTSLKQASYVCFTDAAGNKWKRLGSAVLEEVKEYRYLTDNEVAE